MVKARLLYPDMLRIIAIIGVVIIHVTAPTIGIYNMIGEERFWWTANFMNAAFRWSVPVFVMISGMLLLRPDRTETTLAFYRRRLGAVLVPFLIWSFIYYLWGIRHDLQQFEWISFVRGLLANGIYYHLWFIYMLIVLYMIVPVLRIFVKHAPKDGVLYTAAACVVISNSTDMAGMLGLELGIQVPYITGYLGYFLLGYYLSITNLAIHQRKILYACGIGSYLIIVFGNYWVISEFSLRDNYFYKYTSLPVFAMAAALFVWGKQVSRKLDWSGTKALWHSISLSVYSVYLSHVLFLEWFYERRPWDIVHGNPTVYVPIVTVLVVLSSLLLDLMWRGCRYGARESIKLWDRIPKSNVFFLPVKEIYAYREMLWNMVQKDLRSRYKGSVLGFLWTFLNPLLMLGIYSFVFSSIMKSDIPNFPMFILVALLPWNYFSQAITQGARSMINNADLLKKVYFPREVLPLSVIGSSLINYLFTLVILIPALWLSGVQLTYSLTAFPVVLLLQTMLLIPIVMLVSLGTVYLRDLEHILTVIITIMFYATPVLFPVSFIPEKFRWVFDYNPMTPVIHAYRDLFLYGQWPDMEVLLPMLFVLLAVNIAVLAVFSWLQRHVAEEV